MNAFIRWMFVDRETDEITLAQFPNPPLWVFLGATGIRLVVQPEGTAGEAIEWIGRGALIWWGADELIRGVNPWRRFLGSGVLLWQAAELFR